MFHKLIDGTECDVQWEIGDITIKLISVSSWKVLGERSYYK
jgi:hypothetical protein